MATLSQTRDAFQLRLLTFLYRGSTNSSLVLKGGVAMRVLSGSARFTKDLDFDHDPHRSLASLQNTVRTAIDRAIHGSGLVGATISESKQTDTVARWKISGRTSTGEDLHLAVEVSRRQTPDPNHVLKIPVQIADRTLPRVYVSVYDEQALADNKLAALVDNRRTAPRDIYDLELLLARGVAPSAAAIENLGGQATLMKLVADKLDLMGWTLFRDEVLPTLPVEIQSHVDEDEYLAMKLRLLETLKQGLAEKASNAGSP
jgi:predicted nucleotidyltransferase component of viral defense system